MVGSAAFSPDRSVVPPCRIPTKENRTRLGQACVMSLSTSSSARNRILVHPVSEKTCMLCRGKIGSTRLQLDRNGSLRAQQGERVERIPGLPQLEVEVRE